MENKIIKLKSTARPVQLVGCETLKDTVSSVASELGDGYWCLVYKHDAVRLDHSRSRQFDELLNTPLKRLKEARFFSDGAEFKLWRYEDGLRARLREDGRGVDARVFVEEMVLWGTDVKDERKLIEPGKGTVIELPFAVNDSHLPIKIRLNSYFDYDENGLIRFHDARLVVLVSKDGGPIHG